MFILDRRNFLALTGAVALAPGIARAATGAEVFTADAMGGNVDSIVVMGDKGAVLIDAQMNVPNATKLANVIEATGRTLETIFISHHHPDHVLGLAVLMDRFPGAKPVTHANIRPMIEKTAESYLGYMSKQAPDAFAKRVVIPDALSADHILLEGERLDILDPMHGDTDLVSAVHIPALDTLVASDLAYTDCHVWLAENARAERLDLWRASLDRLEAVGAGTVIAGHRLEGSANDASAYAFTRAYLDKWQAALGSTTTAEGLKAAMLEDADGYGLVFAVDRAVGAVFPQG